MLRKAENTKVTIKRIKVLAGKAKGDKITGERLKHNWEGKRFESN